MTDTSAEIHVPGGWKAKLSGPNTATIIVCLVIVVCIGASTAFLVWAAMKDAERFLAAHSMTQTLLGNVISNQSLIISEVQKSNDASASQGEAITYVLTLTQSQREALKLTMPHVLRKQLNSR